VSEDRNQQLLRLSLLLQLEQRVRHAGKEELPFVMVNETSTIVPYQQAVLWDPEKGRRGRIVAISGAAVPDNKSPFVAWLDKALRHLPPGKTAGDPQTFRAEQLGGELSTEWRKWLPENILWVPLPGLRGETEAAILLVREEPWKEPDLHLFRYLADAYGHAYALSRLHLKIKGPSKKTWSRQIRIWGIVLFLALLCLLPIRQSVLAPAQVVPRDPHLVRAPFDGVVEEFYIQPNDMVAEGQLILSLEDTQLRSHVEVAEKARDITRTEYLQAAQQAFSDSAAKAGLAVLQGRIRQHDADVNYYRTLLERIRVKAPRAGVAVFDDPDDWLGRPVITGQKILVVADPEEVELEISLSVNDAIDSEKGAEVLFFLNIAPTKPLKARLTFSSYSTFITPENVVAYRLKAGFEEPASRPRIGLKGTAKIYGRETRLVLWVFRKPIHILRRWLGL
jgi:hypothetical protein